MCPTRRNGYLCHSDVQVAAAITSERKPALLFPSRILLEVPVEANSLIPRKETFQAARIYIRAVAMSKPRLKLAWKSHPVDPLESPQLFLARRNYLQRPTIKGPDLVK